MGKSHFPESSMSAIQSRTVTPEELLAMPDGKYFELVHGELVEKNVSALSSRVELILGSKINDHCGLNKLGPVFPGTQGIRCFPDDANKVRKPDVFFYKEERFQKSYWDCGFLPIAPDLAAE